MSQVIIGIDCGLSGGITILCEKSLPIVYKMPVKKAVINKKNKNIYDIESILGIFKEYADKNVLFMIEKQGVRMGEGSVSAMTIGVNYGQLLGMGHALGFKVVIITPQKWKKHFPELITENMLQIKAEIKELKILSKTLEEKEEKKENKKTIDKLNRHFKAEAKTSARELVSSLYPSQAHKYVKKNTDGMAESVLIALYGNDNQESL